MHVMSVLAAIAITASTNVTKVEGPYILGNVAVYVVRGPETDSRSYITLGEGMNRGLVSVREKGSGEVDTLQVENRSEEFLFLQVGDIVRGGMQDRTIATDVLISPKSAPTAIDAFCVEDGRWSADGVSAMAFSANDAIVSGMELKRSIQVERDQGRVWRDVAQTVLRAARFVGAPTPRLSASGTYSAIVDNETLRAEREEYLDTLLPRVTSHDDAIGVIVAIGGELVGADVYASHGLFKKLARKVLDSYVQEGILERQKKPIKSPAAEEVREFLESGASPRSDMISDTMERRASENAHAQVFQYRFREDDKPLHSSYVKKR